MANNWNSINVEKVINNDQKEITKAYHLIINWLLFITKQNEELSNDIFCKIISKFDRYDVNKSKLHNFIYTIGTNETTSFFRLKNNNKIKLVYELPPNSTSIADEEYNEEEINNSKMLQIFGVINEDDKQLIINYLSIEGKVKDKEISKNFSRLKKRIKKNINAKTSSTT